MMYEKWTKKRFKNDISKRENMTYDDNEDYYICAGINAKKHKVLSTERLQIYMYQK